MSNFSNGMMTENVMAPPGMHNVVLGEVFISQNTDPCHQYGILNKII